MVRGGRQYVRGTCRRQCLEVHRVGDNGAYEVFTEGGFWRGWEGVWMVLGAKGCVRRTCRRWVKAN